MDDVHLQNSLRLLDMKCMFPGAHSPPHNEIMFVVEDQFDDEEQKIE
jgi:hypothetical protein